ncbi:MAG: EamA family transporter [Gemmatimonadales bacterium]
MPLRVGLAFAVIYVVWGSTYLGILIALESLPPFLLAGARFLVAGSLLYGFARWRGAPMPSRAAWRGAAILGTLMFAIGNAMIVWAETRVDSGLAALVASVTPLWIVLIDHLRRNGRRATTGKWVGVALGIAGLAILFLPDVAEAPRIDPLGAAAVLTASVSWAVGSIAARSLSLPKDTYLASGMTMLGGGAVLMLVATLLGEVTGFDPATVTSRSLVAWGYLVLFGSILAFTCFTWLLAKVDPVKVGTSGLVNPLVALALGWLVADEVISRQALLAAAVTVVGLALILLAPEVRRQPHTGEFAAVRPASPTPAQQPTPAELVSSGETKAAA